MPDSPNKYKVLIVCINPYIRVEFLDYLTSFLGSYITFDAASPSEFKEPSQLEDYGCILFSSRMVQASFPLPVPETITQLVCSRTFNHAYLDQLIRIPPMEKGYYLLEDRHSQAKENPDLLERSSYNFTLSVYDADNRTLYYYKLDT